jgi:hypothetical protein
VKSDVSVVRDALQKDLEGVKNTVDAAREAVKQSAEAVKEFPVPQNTSSSASSTN